MFYNGFVTHACVPKRLPSGSFVLRSPEEATCSESKNSGVQARRIKITYYFIPPLERRIAMIKTDSKQDGRDGRGCWAACREAACQRINETLPKVLDLPARSPALRDEGRAATFNM
jgi:hypothetical protein